ncbi:hypothetical protein [Nocardiopsis valliformis]|uniref:hypothetical protein n=1 Tax=Nocardiopsis valliformis TaxID=239974 RepID=UPI001269137D|nr:hypothetical protein [Nocardiopsis valliformis]
MESIGLTQTPGEINSVALPLAALHSAIRRRGVAAMDGGQPGEVRAEHAGRCIVVRLSGGKWVSPVDGGGRTAPIGREGEEDSLARWIAGELLGRV